MATFIDESGGTGWSPGAQPYFRLAAVWVPNDAVEPCRESIREARRDLGRKATYEFKFNGTGHLPQVREAFFRAALCHEFRFAACCYDKRHERMEKIEPQEFFWGACTTLAACLRDTFRHAEAEKGILAGKPELLRELIVVDDNKDADFLNAVKGAFRGLASGWKPGANLVGKVKFRDSAPDEMMQLVDMVVGAVGESLEGDSPSFQSIQNRSVGVICIP